MSDFLSAVENFNKTMEQLHGVAVRVNSLLDTVEEPIRAFVPQVTKTIKTADAMVEQLAGPIERVAPGLAKLADVLSAPALTSFPTDLTEFMEVLSDLARRLQPLGQIAESAGNMFGLRALTGSALVLPPAGTADPGDIDGRAEQGAAEEATGKSPRRRPRPRRLRRRSGQRQEGPRQEAGHRWRPEVLAPCGADGADQCLATNGVETMRPTKPLPRTSIVTSVPISVSGGMNARAMPCPSTGEKLPLVTTPTGLIVDQHRAFGAWRPAAVGGDAHQQAVDTAVRSASRALRPRNSGFRPGHHPAQARLAGG